MTEESLFLKDNHWGCFSNGVTLLRDIGVQVRKSSSAYGKSDGLPPRAPVLSPTFAKWSDLYL